MSGYQMRAGQGSLFKNKKKTSEKSPNLSGKVMLPNGEVRWISGWSKKTEAGEAWISISIGDVVHGREGNAAPPLDAHNQAKGNGYQKQGDDDDIPF